MRSVTIGGQGVPPRVQGGIRRPHPDRSASTPAPAPCPIASVLLAGHHRDDGCDRARIAALVALIAPAADARAVSGALVTADRRFALLVEGLPAVIDPMLAAFAGEGGHPAMAVLSRDQLAEGRLPGWRIVYDGRSFFVDRAIAAAASGEDALDRAIRIARLLTIITGLTGAAR